MKIDSMNIFEINLEAIRDANVLVLAYVTEQSQLFVLYTQSYTCWLQKNAIDVTPFIFLSRSGLTVDCCLFFLME